MEDKINDLIDEWHRNPDLKMELHEYLKMSKEEYEAFVNDCKIPENYGL